MNRWRLALALAAAAVLAETIAATGAETVASSRDPVWSPNGRQIAFLSDRASRGGLEDIYVVNRDGGGLRRITRRAVGKAGLAWSPDGKWIAYQASAYIDEVSRDGRRHRRLTGCCAGQPDFSPSGQRIVYANKGSIHTMRESGSGKTLVASPETADEALLAPTWSPDGRRFGFAIGTAEHGEFVTPYLAIIRQQGGPRTKLAIGHLISSTDWSPDGRRILLVEDPTPYRGSDDPRISVLDLRTRKLLDLKRKASWWARWSPDGRNILFTHGGSMLVMKSDGSHVRRLVPRR